MTSADGVLLLGFGGVTDTCCGRLQGCPGRVECFIMKVLGDDPTQVSRVAEVAQHYHHLGGVSPYNALTFAQAAALEAALTAAGTPMPVRCGFRNFPPWYSDGLRQLKELGCQNIVLAVLAPHQTQRSWQQYLDEAGAAAVALGEAAPSILGHTAPWWNEAGFIEANLRQLRRVTADWDPLRLQGAALVLTAHAIPVPAERRSPYRAQVAETARLLAKAFGHDEHHVAFQSAPDESRVPWSHPKVDVMVTDLVATGCRDILVQSIGFLVDHVEVVYDLDIELRQRCAHLGATYTRAPCVHDDPAFIDLLRRRVQEVQVQPLAEERPAADRPDRARHG